MAWWPEESRTEAQQSKAAQEQSRAETGRNKAEGDSTGAEENITGAEQKQKRQSRAEGPEQSRDQKQDRQSRTGSREQSKAEGDRAGADQGRTDAPVGIEPPTTSPKQPNPSPRGCIVSYTWPGSNWRPSACEADVIATRPQVHGYITHVEATAQLICSTSVTYRKHHTRNLTSAPIHPTT